VLEPFALECGVEVVKVVMPGGNKYFLYAHENDQSGTPLYESSAYPTLSVSEVTATGAIDSDLGDNNNGYLTFNDKFVYLFYADFDPDKPRGNTGLWNLVLANGQTSADPCATPLPPSIPSPTLPPFAPGLVPRPPPHKPPESPPLPSAPPGSPPGTPPPTSPPTSPPPSPKPASPPFTPGMTSTTPLPPPFPPPPGSPPVPAPPP
jgi:hypothetical protein